MSSIESIPTNSIKVWHMLLNRYIGAKEINGISINVEKANQELITLYRNYQYILGEYGTDENVLYKINDAISEYETDGFPGLASLELNK
jgi:hypothetical protein